ncbi:hypothetical protein CgunFtcFv8_022222 [Champsocephalus gunnari]|uniref:SAM-dependent MTase RsmB/NOP-type domain-containing protein n=1 Tax=Champsocephalus gunnari TaxID=52237 RepID=A0AAN8DPH9_CHAGU|nr:hypothetical protein CgunFtcFv8_022222 [Champsocephalus gunnari]
MPSIKDRELLEDIIADSCFHTSQHISSDLLPLAMVMLFDFQDRRFLSRERLTKEEMGPFQEVRDLETSLHRCRTKLAASLARCRVKQSLQSVSCFLSDPVRTKQHRAKRLPLYAWVNTLKASVDEVCAALQRAGLCEVEIMTALSEGSFCRDPLCPDTLVFSPQLHALLQHSSLTSTHALNTQDRSVCVAVSALRPLLFDNGDVLAVGSFSAVTVAHVAVAAADRSGRVLVCGADHTTSQIDEIQELLTQMDIKNVRVLSEAFSGLDEWDASVQRLKVIIALPQCSSSALNDPVPTMHSEHGNWDLLPELCHSSVSRSKIHTMASQQARLLAHAVSFPKVQTVVYCTRSVYPEENEQLVKRVLDKTHTHPKLLPFRVNGPIFSDDSQSGDTTESKFFRLETSQFSNGCFIARLSRQADPTKVETVHDVLARAAAKGLLGGIIPELSKTNKKGKSKKNRAASASSKPSSPSGREGQLGEGEKPVAPSQHEEKKALAHKLSNNATIQSQQNVFSPPPSAPPAASKQVQRLNPEPEGAEKTLKHTVRAESPFKVRGNVRPKEEEATEEVLTHTDFVLPPICSASCSSVSSRSGSSLTQRPTRTPHSQRAQICASSSSIYLPGLQKRDHEH